MLNLDRSGVKSDVEVEYEVKFSFLSTVSLLDLHPASLSIFFLKL